MRNIFSFVVIAVIVLHMLVSCKAITSLVDGGETVAKVGSNRLSRAQVEALIPSGMSSEDSIKMALQYINSWASDIVFSEIAEEQLSKAEKDVEKEIEDYRKSLLKFRYEQRYVNERLDTAVAEPEIAAYYEKHKQNFIAEFPVVRARFMRIPADSPNIGIIKSKMSSSDPADIAEADSLAYSSADKYTDYGMKWISIMQLSKEFGQDYGSLLSGMRNSFIEVHDKDYDKVNIAYVSDFIPAGEPLPVEYCQERIKDILIGIRRHQLVSTLEQDLLEDAREKGKFVIY